MFLERQLPWAKVLLLRVRLVRLGWAASRCFAGGLGRSKTSGY